MAPTAPAIDREEFVSCETAPGLDHRIPSNHKALGGLIRLGDIEEVFGVHSDYTSAGRIGLARLNRPENGHNSYFRCKHLQARRWQKSSSSPAVPTSADCK